MPKIKTPLAPVRDNDEWMTIKQAGEAYPALGERYVRRLTEERRLPIHKLPGRVLIRRSDIEAYLAGVRHEVGAAS